jgi:hypothetical protein
MLPPARVAEDEASRPCTVLRRAREHTYWQLVVRSEATVRFYRAGVDADDVRARLLITRPVLQAAPHRPDIGIARTRLAADHYPPFGCRVARTSS